MILIVFRYESFLKKVAVINKICFAKVSWKIATIRILPGYEHNNIRYIRFLQKAKPDIRKTSGFVSLISIQFSKE